MGNRSRRPGKDDESHLTQNQLHELLESDQARLLIEGAEERGFVEPAELEAFALEHDLAEEEVEQLARELETIGLDEALALLAAPKQRGRGAPRAPLRELGEDPSSGRSVTVKEGRFGPYVTDGETNASLRAGDAVESLTLDRAFELLAERRARGPATKRPAAKRPAKRPAKRRPQGRK